MRKPAFVHVCLTGIVALAAGCGGSSTGPKAENTLSSAEAQLVAVNLFSEISRALSTATVSHTAIGASTVALAATVPTTFTQTVNGTCSAGGTIKGSYVFTTDFNASGSGTESGTVTVTSAGCQVSTGTRTIGVDGNFTLTFSVAFINSVQSADYVWTEKGNFSWSGGGCAIDYTVRLTPAHKETITGTICGQTLNYAN